MKRKFLKKFLTCAMAFSLMAADAAPVLAAEMQSEDIAAQENQILPEETEGAANDLPLTGMEEDAAAVPLALEDTTAEEPVITAPVIRTDQYLSHVYFYLDYAGTNTEACELNVTANNVNVYSVNYYESGNSIDSDDFGQRMASGMTYTFTLKPFKYNEDYDKVYGTEKSVTWTAPTVPAVTGLAVKEMTPDGFVFSYNEQLPEGAGIRFEYSENPAFSDEIAEVETTSDSSLPYEYLDAGVVYHVRAYVRMYGMQGAYSNVITVTAPVAEVTGISAEITNTSITLSMYAGYGDYTGFEVSRKSGKKYQKLATTSDNIFADKGLESNTKYQYRVRTVYYNSDTKKTSYGDYTYKTVTTGSAVLNLKAEAAGKKKIKLKWTKISGASGYDVYRYTGSSYSQTYKSGEDYDFSKYELVKSLGKKKKSYTDKKVTAGEGYTYIVRAYKLVKGKKQYFAEDAASAYTKFSFSTSVNIYKEAQNPKTGTVAIAWHKIPQAGGYLIEKKDSEKNEWVTQARLKVGKTTYTLPASPAGKTVTYRVRAYKGNKYSGSDTVEVTGHIAVVTNVKASATAEGISISWNAVPGASYYKVYRTAGSSIGYNADLKTYFYGDSYLVTPKVFKAADNALTNYYYTVGNGTAKMTRDYDAEEKLFYHHPNNYYVDETVAGTSVIDYSYTYHRVSGTNDNTISYGPKDGVTYNYYVVAYGLQQDTSVTSYVSYLTASSYGNSKSASAVYAGNVVKPKAPTVKVKGGKKSATLTIKKTANASGYAVYRSSKKKGAYKLVALTTKTKFKDSGLTPKKKYYYKVKAVGKNSMGTDVYSPFSKVKSIKAK